MASAYVSEKVEARLGNPWNGIPVLGRNTVGDTPADGSAYLVVQYPLGDEDHASLGDPANRLFREEGGIRFVLHVPTGSGHAYWLAQIEALRADFRGVEFDGIVTFAPSAPFEHDLADNEQYYLISTVVPYQYDLEA